MRNLAGETPRGAKRAPLASMRSGFTPVGRDAPPPGPASTSVDLATEPPDGSLARVADLPVYLRHLAIPWRREGDLTIFAAAGRAGAEAVASARGGVRADRFVPATPEAIRAALTAAFAPELAARAAERRAAARSIRAGAARWQWLAPRLALAGLAALAIAAPAAALGAALFALAAVVAANAAIWGAALAVGRGPAAPVAPRALRLPKFSLLIPLYHEAATMPLLVRALSALAYPPDRLEVFLILEEDDDETAAALACLPLPAFASVLTAPAGAPRTKPRALNFALEFATGDLIGIYDAEDRPPPDQLARVAARFAAAPPDVACVQARLGYYNRHENLLTRFFELEYAAWFDVMLPGLRRLGAPVPLGGTSLFIRRRVVEELGGWDSHNVTEDADLGMAIARAGYRTTLTDSLTEEEANSRAGAWVRQRSRWLKGYLATWITHMRSPGRLWRDLGPPGFVALNLVLLGPVLGYLALPALWAIAAAELAFAVDFGAAGEAVRVAGLVCAAALAAAAALGALRRRWPAGLLLIPLTPLYWPLGAAAAYLAVWDLIVRPYAWRKTTHGRGRVAANLRRESLEALGRG